MPSRRECGSSRWPRPGLRHVTFAAAIGRVLARERPARAVVWFAAATYGAATLAACRLARVPCLVVAGGMDVASCPEIGFGEARGGWRRTASRWTLEQAALRVGVLRVGPPGDCRARADPRHRGRASGRRHRLVPAAHPAARPGAARADHLRRHRPGHDRSEGARSADAGRGPAARRARRRHRRAGPGRSGRPRVRRRAPPNVSFAGHVSREALRALYARAAVVAQLSRHEGFGVAAAEAAAMGCTLVTTDLPVFDEVLGPTRGRVALDAPDADVAAALRDALDAPTPVPRWADIDRRYGVAVRTAAWDAWLTREGLV